MHAADETQAGGADDFHVLEVALSPAPVANCDIDQRWRGFFPGAAAVGGHAHLPAAAAHQGGLDEIMRKDEAAERLAAREFGQAAVLRECGHANDGVVTPIIAAVAGPCAQAPIDDGSVDAGRKLLQAPKKGRRADQLRSGLQYPQVRIGLHGPYQPLQSRRIDQAVAVEHDHMIVAAAPARYEVLEVAGFARDVLPTPPIPYRH